MTPYGVAPWMISDPLDNPEAQFLLSQLAQIPAPTECSPNDGACIQRNAELQQRRFDAYTAAGQQQFYDPFLLANQDYGSFQGTVTGLDNVPMQYNPESGWTPAARTAPVQTGASIAAYTSPSGQAVQPSGSAAVAAHATVAGTALITANQVSPEQARAWMESAIGSPVGNVHQWCYFISEATGVPCPDPGSFGITSDSQLLTAEQFLDALRSGQLAAVAQSPAPGGGVAGGGSTAANGGGQGVLGATNCEICQKLSKNPLLLIGVAVAAYYLFIK